MASLSFKINEETDKLNSFISNLERLKGVLAGLPDGTKEFDVIDKKIADVERKMEQSMKKIVEMQNKMERSVAPAENASPVKGETASYNELIGSLDQVLGARGANVAAMLREQNAIRLIQQELSSLEDIEERGLNLNEAQGTRRLQLTESLNEHRQALTSLQQIVDNDIKLNQAAQDSMNEMSQSLARMRAAYKELNATERGSEFGQDLLKNIQETDGKMKQLDATMQSGQGNVENYKTQWSGLTMSIQQIAKELPSLADSPKVFFSALSNNLPIVTAEIKKAEAEYKVLVDQGKAGTPVWKQVAGSLFSWQSVLNVGITLLSLYGDKIVDWIGNIFSAGKATKSLSEAQDDVVDRINGSGTGIGEQIVRIKSLREEWNSLGSDMGAKNKFISDNKSAFENLGVSVTDAYDAENLLVNNTDDFIEALKLRAQATASQKLASEQYEKAIKEEIELENEKKKGPSFGDKIMSWFVNSALAGGNQLGNTVKSENVSAGAYREERLKRKEEDVKAAYAPGDAYFNLGQEKLRAANALLDKSGIKKDANEDDSGTNNKYIEEQKHIAEQLYQLRLDNQQREIDLMEDGTKKKLAQIKLDYKKERQAIQKQSEEWAGKQGGTITAQQAIQISTAYSNAKDLKDKGKADVYKQELGELLKQYQDYDAKRREIEEKFTNDYNALENQRTLQNSKQIDGAQGELEFKRKESMDHVNEEFASRSEDFQMWMNEIANMSLDKLGAALRRAQSELGLLKIAGVGGSRLAVAEQKVTSTEKAINQAKTKEKEDSPDKRTLEDWKALNSVLVGVGNSFKEIGESVGGAVGDIMAAAGEINGSTLKMIDGIVSLANWSAFSTSKTADVASKSIQSVEKASVILAVISAALQVAMKIASLIKGKSKVEQDSERLGKVTDKMAQTQGVINNLIEKRAGLIKDATAAEKGYLVQLSKTAIEVQKTQNEKLFQSLLKNDFLAKKGKDNNLSLKKLGITSIEGLKEFMESERLLEYLNDGYGIRDLSSWEAIIKNSDTLVEKGKELEATWKEAVTGMTLDDAKGALDDFLLDVETTEKDVADSFEKYMKQAILNAVKTQYLNKALEGWYEQFFNRMDDGELSKDDVNALKGKYQEIYQTAQNRIDSLLEAAGISSSSIGEQSATSKGLETMSQDTASELNGRFAALQMSNEEVKNQSFMQTQSIIQMLGSLSSIQVTISAQQRTGDELLQYAVQSYMELQGINENTGVSAKYLRDIKDDIAEVKKNTSYLL